METQGNEQGRVCFLAGAYAESTLKIRIYKKRLFFAFDQRLRETGAFKSAANIAETSVSNQIVLTEAAEVRK